MGTWYYDETEFLNAVTAYSYTFENLALGLIPNNTYVTPDGRLTATYPTEIVLIDGAIKGLLSADNFTTSNYNAVGLEMFITDLAYNSDDPEEIFAEVTAEENTTTIAPPSSNFFIGYIFDNLNENSMSVNFAYAVSKYIITQKIYLGIDGNNLLDPIVESSEILSSENSLYSENLLELQSISSDEDFDTNTVYAQAYLDPSSIQSEETFKKPLIFPTPYPGKIYFWYEQIHSIEFELNVRSQQ